MSSASHGYGDNPSWRRLCHCKIRSLWCKSPDSDKNVKRRVLPNAAFVLFPVVHGSDVTDSVLSARECGVTVCQRSIELVRGVNCTVELTR